MYCVNTKVTSQTIAHHNPNPNQKKPQCKPQIPNLKSEFKDNDKGRQFADLTLGLGILE